MSEERIIHTQPAGYGKELRVSLIEFRSRPCIAVRLWIDRDGQWTPGPGLNIWPDQIRELREGLKLALAELFGGER